MLDTETAQVQPYINGIPLNLNDRIIDEAEQLAIMRVLPPYPTMEMITDAVSDILNVRLQYNSIGARLAEAAFNRIAFATDDRMIKFWKGE